MKFSNFSKKLPDLIKVTAEKGYYDRMNPSMQKEFDAANGILDLDVETSVLNIRNLPDELMTRVLEALKDS
jgi:hypothetical protein